MADPVSRSSDVAAANTLGTRTVDVYLQRSPQRPGGSDPARGIESLSWRVMSAGVSIATGRTTADGKVTVPIRNGQPSLLQLLVGGNPVATYTITERTAPAEAATSLSGRQRRLRSMGYHLGSADVDGLMGPSTDRSTLEFQGDQSLDMTGVIDSSVQTQITTRAGY